MASTSVALAFACAGKETLPQLLNQSPSLNRHATSDRGPHNPSSRLIYLQNDLLSTSSNTTPSRDHNLSKHTITMDSKSLQEKSRELLKAFEGGDPSSTLLDLLKPLAAWSASEELLRQSKIGVAVNKLRSSKDPKVASEAGRLINKWKGDVNKAKRSTASTSSPAAANGRSSSTASPAPKKEAVAAPPAPKKFSVAPEKRNSKDDGVDTAITGNQTRNGCVTLMYNGLCFMSQAAPDDVLAVARSVELAAYNAYQPETSQTYKTKMRSLFSNLKMKDNQMLREGVFNGSITADRFVKMTSDELKSEEKRKKDQEMEKENMNKAMTAQEEKSVSTTYVVPSPPFRILPTCSTETNSKHTDLILRPTFPTVYHETLGGGRVEYEVFPAFGQISAKTHHHPPQIHKECLLTQP